MLQFSQSQFLDGLVLIGMTVIILTACLPVVTSGERVNFNNDFFQYASRHEQVRQGLLKYHTLPQRTHFFGGGFPTIGDPEDPTFNPLILLTLCLGTVTGLKWIGVLSMIFGALGLYAFARKALGYGRWGAIASALFFGLSLWLPVRMRDGNPNEVYYHFIPACLLCLFLARHQKRYLLVLTALFITMLSDGKLTFFASVMYIGLLCCFPLIPGVSLWSSKHPPERLTWGERFQPLKGLSLTLALTFLLYLFRILPAVELIQTNGSLARMELFFHAPTYGPGTISAYSFSRLWQEAVAWKGEAGLTQLSSVCIGWIPLILAGGACILNWRRAFPWFVGFLLFAWLAMAHQAPFDLFRYLWKLPILNAVGNPAKYFGCLPVLSVCILAGQSFDGLRKLQWKWMRHAVAATLIAAGVVFLYPKVLEVSRISYTYTIPSEFLEKSDSFYQVRGDNLERSRSEPLQANTYVNLLRGIGTIDWYTGIPIAENAIPRYLVTKSGEYVPPPDYRGECFWLESEEVIKCEFSPHRIRAAVRATHPGTLIVNQNYHRDWRVNRGTLGEWKGLLAIQLSAGEYQLELRYFSRSFALGLLLSFISLIGLAAIVGLYHKGYIIRIFQLGYKHVSNSLKNVLTLYS